MCTSPYVVPVYRSIILVSTVLSRDQQGNMVHTITADTTLPDTVEVVYDLR